MLNLNHFQHGICNIPVFISNLEVSLTLMLRALFQHSGLMESQGPPDVFKTGQWDYLQ